MGRNRLAWRNVIGDRFRSLTIFTCAILVAGLALTATFVVRGAEASLRFNLQRLGADILALPWGTMTDKIGGVRLVSADVKGWMPRAYMDKIADVEGVAAVSPQLHLDTLQSSPYCAQCDLHLVAFDPQTDFTLRPWLEGSVPQDLAPDEAYVGSRIMLPEGDEDLLLYGYELRPAQRLSSTGTSIDQSLFVSFETAEMMVRQGRVGSAKGLQLQTMPESISATMVRVDIDSDPHEVALRILEEVPGVVPLETPNLFQAERRQMIGILQTLLGLLVGVWLLAVVFMGMVFSLAVNERRQEIGVMRALGFPGRSIFGILLTEGMILALAGGLVGVIFAGLALTVGGEQLAAWARLPLQAPPWSDLLGWAVGGQLMALISVTLAALIPAWLISRQEVALTMRA